MSVSDLFIRRPVMTVLIMAGVLIFGVMAYRLLPVSELPNVDYPTPILSTVFEAPDWDAILSSGNGDWQGNWKPFFAAAEKQDGSGVWRVCQVQLSGRIRGNPVAEIFSRRLLEKRVARETL